MVYKTLKSVGAQPPEIEHHRKEAEGLRKMETEGLRKTETEDLRKRRPGVSITHTRLRSLHQENL